MAIAFVGVTGNGADAFVDAGVVMRKVVRRSFGVRLDAQGRMGIATLRAFLETSDDRSIIRIDGKRLTTVPTLIDAHAALGETTMHTIEIEVPAEVAEGAFASAVRWEVTVD
ncbi:MAG TPA: hypothetical protein VJZ00_06420 [Thermoanaerobaculia bacterium]|nr:hypothetical protein [Thermoanaerobaculia bacterium]